MARKSKKQELFDILKFTPIKVQLTLQGYGGETYAGQVNRSSYEFFKKNQYSIEEYSNDWDNEWNERIPDEHKPFNPGNPYDCDNLWHASGAELSSHNQICITDENINDIWTCELGLDELEDQGVTVDQLSGQELDDLDNGTVVFCGGSGEKGCFFDAEFTLTAPFDPKKLKIGYEDCDGWCIINYVEYDGEELDGSGGYSTSGKWTEHKWIIVGDEQVYESVDLEDRDPTVDYTKFPTDEEIDELDKLASDDIVGDEHQEYKDDQLTDWFPVDIKPVRSGEYEVDLENPAWPFNRLRADWTGRTWKCNGTKIKISQWRGLNFDATSGA